MQFIVAIGLALVTSLDSLGMGVAFGLNGTRIRLKAHLIISAVMFLITAAGVVAGHRLSLLLHDDRLTRGISAFLFVAVGIGMFLPWLRAFRTGQLCYSADEASDCCPVRAAEAAGEVRVRDAFGLGFLLSINNVGAGIGEGMMNLGPLAMAALAVLFNILCLLFGHQMGSLLRRTPVRSWAQFLAAATMVAIGIYELCQPVSPI